LKNEMRKLYLETRNSIPYEDKVRKSGLIQRKLLTTDTYKKADSIFVYIAMKNEVDTAMIIEKAIKDNKKIAVPISLNNREMFFVPYEGMENLVKTKFGVLEPVSNRKKEVLPNKDSIFIVPGVAFDEEGHRMGYGGGYYDTYIEKYDVKDAIAIAFEAQIQKTIPYEEHDKKIKYIITEKRIIGGADL